jgi:hypothetical protein
LRGACHPISFQSPNEYQLEGAGLHHDRTWRAIFCSISVWAPGGSARWRIGRGLGLDLPPLTTTFDVPEPAHIERAFGSTQPIGRCVECA